MLKPKIWDHNKIEKEVQMTIFFGSNSFAGNSIREKCSIINYSTNLVSLRLKRGWKRERQRPRRRRRDKERCVESREWQNEMSGCKQ